MFRKTVRTKLMKKKMSLGALLHETIQRQWDEIKSHMFKFPYFEKWTDQMVHQCCVHSNVLTFEENDLLYEEVEDVDDDDEEGLLTKAIDESFEAVIKLQKMREIIKDFPMFKEWRNHEVNFASYGSRVIGFNEGDILSLKDDANVFVTYFILEGSATVVQRLVVEKYKLKGDKRFRYRLHPNQHLHPSEKTSRIEFVFMQTCILKQGACFGLGENLSKHTMKANKGLKCLVIPKHIIHQNFTPDNIWKRIIQFLDMNYPSTERIFEMFVAGREWHLDSKELNRKERFTRLYPLETTIHDVPLTIRTDDIFLANRFKRAETDPFYLFGEKYKNEEKKGIRLSVIETIDVKELPKLREAEQRREQGVNTSKEEEDYKRPTANERQRKRVVISTDNACGDDVALEGSADERIGAKPPADEENEAQELKTEDKSV